jgi:hypothetical protein
MINDRKTFILRRLQTPCNSNLSIVRSWCKLIIFTSILVGSILFSLIPIITAFTIFYYIFLPIWNPSTNLKLMFCFLIKVPPSFEIRSKNQSARQGEPAVLQCEAKGGKPICFLWIMNNKRLDSKSDIRYFKSYNFVYQYKKNYYFALC